MNIICYRIEHIEDGIGPYIRDKTIPSFNNRKNTRSTFTRPVPDEDGLGFIERDQIVGCPDIIKLRKWFKPYIDDLIKHDFVPVKIELLEPFKLSKSKKQCVFPKNHIVKKTKLEWTILNK